MEPSFNYVHTLGVDGDGISSSASAWRTWSMVNPAAKASRSSVGVDSSSDSSPESSSSPAAPKTWSLAIARHRVHALAKDFLVQLLSLFLLSLPSILGPECGTLLLFENLGHLHNLHPLDQLMKVQGWANVPGVLLSPSEASKSVAGARLVIALIHLIRLFHLYPRGTKEVNKKS
jgi:hypothetical protein